MGREWAINRRGTVANSMTAELTDEQTVPATTFARRRILLLGDGEREREKLQARGSGFWIGLEFSSENSVGRG